MSDSAKVPSISITLPDGSTRTFSGPVTVSDVAASIGAGLARSTVAGRVDGQLVDACDLIECDAMLQVITPKDEDSPGIIRHSCAHLLGHALKQLYPTAQMVIGPVIIDVFHHDVAYVRPLTPADSFAIEARLVPLLAKDSDA